MLAKCSPETASSHNEKVVLSRGHGCPGPPAAYSCSSSRLAGLHRPRACTNVCPRRSRAAAGETRRRRQKPLREGRVHRGSAHGPQGYPLKNQRHVAATAAAASHDDVEGLSAQRLVLLLLLCNERIANRARCVVCVQGAIQQ